MSTRRRNEEREAEDEVRSVLQSWEEQAREGMGYRGAEHRDARRLAEQQLDRIAQLTRALTNGTMWIAVREALRVGMLAEYGHAHPREYHAARDRNELRNLVGTLAPEAKEGRKFRRVATQNAAASRSRDRNERAMKALPIILAHPKAERPALIRLISKELGVSESTALRWLRSVAPDRAKATRKAR